MKGSVLIGGVITGAVGVLLGYGILRGDAPPALRDDAISASPAPVSRPREPDEADRLPAGDGEEDMDDVVELTHEDILLSERASNDALRSRFAQEAVDPAWQAVAERGGRDLFQRVEGLGGATIECRTTLCEVRPHLDDGEASRALLGIIRDRDGHQLFAGVRNAGLEDADDPMSTTWYLRRQTGTRTIEP